MKPGDICYIQQNGKWFEYTFVNSYDWQDAVRIQNGVGEMTCKASELITKDQYDEILHTQKKEEIQMRLAVVIGYWESGLRSSKIIAEKIQGETSRSIGQKIACAKRWGLIKDEKPPVD